MAAVNEVITKFSFAGSISPLANYNSTLGKSIITLAAFTAGTALAAVATARWITNVTAAIDPLVQLSRQTGEAVGKIQAYGFVASVTGSNVNALSSSVEGLASRIGEAAQGGGEGLQVFSRLGIGIRDMSGRVKSTTQIMEELRSSLVGFSDAEKINFVEKLGIDKSLVQLLSLSSAQMQELLDRANAFGVLTKEQANDAADYNNSLTVLRFGMNALQQQIAVGLAPQMQALADTFSQFLLDNKDLIQNGITLLFESVIQLGKTITNLLPVLALGAAALIAVKIAAIGVNAAFKRMLPVVVITAAILLIEDLIVLFKGGESAIGKWASKFNDFVKVFTGIDIAAGFREGLEWLTNKLSSIYDMFLKIAEFGGKIGSFLPFGGEDRLTPSGSSSSSSTNNSINQNVKIDIVTDSPIAAGQAVASGLQQQLGDAQTQFGVGGR